MVESRQPEKGEERDCMKLSDFIRTNIDPIIQTWEQFAKDIASAHHLDTAALRDHASGILSAIAADLDRPQTPHEQAEKSKGRGPHSAKETDAGLHGALRMSKGFNVNEAMSEFRALRASVLRLWGESNPTASQASGNEIIRFNEAIDQALTESLARYSTDIRLFDTLLSSSPDLHYIFDVDGRLVYANKSLMDLYGMASSEDMVGKNFFDLGISVAFELQQQLQQVIDTKMTYRGEMPRPCSPGNDGTYEYLFVPVINDEGKVEAIAGTARDITERKAAEEKTKRSANYDALTGLPNRNLFRDRLQWEVKHSERTGLPMALLFIDLDGFKEVNDQLGHDAGDQLLQQAAQRIRSCVRDTDEQRD
jgi:PAS domain S-box-containing protein